MPSADLQPPDRQLVPVASTPRPPDAPPELTPPEPGALPGPVTAAQPVRLEPFQALIQTARAAHHVRTPLPSLFNPLFRPQGAVNRHILSALQEIGAVVQQLGEQAQQRDRLIETLLTQLATQNAQRHQHDLAVASFIQLLGQKLDALITTVGGMDIEARIESAALRADIATVSAASASAQGLQELIQQTAGLAAAQAAHATTAAEQAQRLEALTRQAAVLEATQATLAATATTQTQNLQELAAQTAHLESAQATAASSLPPLQTALDNQTTLTKELERTAQTVTTRLAGLELLVNELSSGTRVLQGQAQAAANDDRAQLRSELESKFKKLTAQLRQEIDILYAAPSSPPQLGQLAEQIVDIRVMLSSLQTLGRAADFDLLGLGEAARRLQHTVATLETRLAHLEHAQDGASAPPSFHEFYRAFEARFRGSRELIKERVTSYVEPVTAALARTHTARSEILDTPAVLDLGSGRGEWLELLREHDIHARGIDLNKVFIDDCRDLGLDVIRQDALEHLRAAASDSVAAITSFHLVEHLTFPLIIELMAEAHRALAPGGILVLETPNPNNLLVAAVDFHLDPTHRQPIPPPLLEFTAQQAGFSQVRVVPANPYPASSFLPENDETDRRWNRLFYGEQDYAIIAEK